MMIPRKYLPTVWESKAAKGLSFIEMQQKYLAMPKQGLKVTGYLINGYVPSEPSGALHLDGILSSAVFAAHPCNYKLPSPCGVVPLPLKTLWQSPEGVALYASSDFEPDVHHKGQEYWHKRYPSTHNDFVTLKKMNVKTTAGQYKDYRVPLDVRVANTISAVCIGNKDEIERLLGFITHVGKKSSQGFGRVVKWQVEVVDVSESDVIANRAVPIESKLKDEGKIRHATWTSPYWFTGWAKECVV